MSRRTNARHLCIGGALTLALVAGAAHAASDGVSRKAERPEATQRPDDSKPAWQRKLDRFLDAVGIKTGPEATGAGSAADMPECLKAQAAGIPVGCGYPDSP